jgi:hypothetical protein
VGLAGGAHDYRARRAHIREIGHDQLGFASTLKSRSTRSGAPGGIVADVGFGGGPGLSFAAGPGLR